MEPSDRVLKADLNKTPACSTSSEILLLERARNLLRGNKPSAVDTANNDLELEDSASSRFPSEIIEKIVETLQKHLPFSFYGQEEGQQKLMNIAVSFEKKIYSAATDESDYLRMISLQIQNPMADSLLTFNAANTSSISPVDPEGRFRTKKTQFMELSISTEELMKPPSSHDTEKVLSLSSSSSKMEDDGWLGEKESLVVNEGDWRTQVQVDPRMRIIDMIFKTLKRLLPFGEQEGLVEIQKIAVRFEEKVYTGATSQSDYLRKISLKMLTMETKSQDATPKTWEGHRSKKRKSMELCDVKASETEKQNTKSPVLFNFL